MTAPQLSEIIYLIERAFRIAFLPSTSEDAIYTFVCWSIAIGFVILVPFRRIRIGILLLVLLVSISTPHIVDSISPSGPGLGFLLRFTAFFITTICTTAIIFIDCAIG